MTFHVVKPNFAVVALIRERAKYKNPRSRHVDALYSTKKLP
jgi:hypothetical protein